MELRRKESRPRAYPHMRIHTHACARTFARTLAHAHHTALPHSPHSHTPTPPHSPHPTRGEYFKTLGDFAAFYAPPDTRTTTPPTQHNTTQHNATPHNTHPTCTGEYFKTLGDFAAFYAPSSPAVASALAAAGVDRNKTWSGTLFAAVDGGAASRRAGGGADAPAPAGAAEAADSLKYSQVRRRAAPGPNAAAGPAPGVPRRWRLGRRPAPNGRRSCFPPCPNPPGACCSQLHAHPQLPAVHDYPSGFQNNVSYATLLPGHNVSLSIRRYVCLVFGVCPSPAAPRGGARAAPAPRARSPARFEQARAEPRAAWALRSAFARRAPPTCLAQTLAGGGWSTAAPTRPASRSSGT